MRQCKIAIPYRRYVGQSFVRDAFYAKIAIGKFHNLNPNQCYGRRRKKTTTTHIVRDLCLCLLSAEGPAGARRTRKHRRRANKIAQNAHDTC